MPSAAPVALHVTRQVFALEGETRVNLLRVLAVALFYAVHLVNRYAVGMETGQAVMVGGVVVPVFDTIATALAIAWGAMAAAVLLLVRTHLARRWLGWATTLADLAFLTALLAVGNGPGSPLLLVFFPLIAASGLRGRRELVWLATLGSLLAYGLMVGGAMWIGRSELLPPAYHLLVVSSALVVTGVVVDLGVSVLWRTVQSHVDRVAEVARVGGEPLTVPETPGGCPWCGLQSASGLVCPRCEQPLVGGGEFRTGRTASVLQLGPVHLGWAMSVVVLVTGIVIVGIGVAVDWPALVVPYIGGSILVVVALARLLQLDLRQSEDDAAVRRTASTLGTATATLALGFTSILVLLGLLFLLALSMFIVVVAVCALMLAA